MDLWTARNGIIPAYAGSTATLISWLFCSRDHPRLRGEHSLTNQPLTIMLGSSPLTRGAQCVCVFVCALVGIIPAYAGSTSSHGFSALFFWDHPRLRGEHCSRSIRGNILKGSSPLTRGAPAIVPGVVVGHGIIPAYAGSTMREEVQGQLSKDHPRLRGEHQPWQKRWA